MALPLIIAGAAGGMSAFTSFSEAKSREGYASAAASAQRKAVGVQNAQLSDQAALERLKAHNHANRIRSTVRVAAGESGIGFSGTYEALMRQADYDEGLNAEIINRNLMNGIKASNSQLQPSQPVMNPLVSAFAGFLGGAQSGMQIGSGLGGLEGPEKAT